MSSIQEQVAALQKALTELTTKVSLTMQEVKSNDLPKEDGLDKPDGDKPNSKTNIDKTNIDKTNIDKTNIDKTNIDKTNIDEPDNKDSMPLYSPNWSIEWLYKKYNHQIARFILLHLDAGIKLDEIWNYYSDVTYNRCLDGNWELKVNTLSKNQYDTILNPLLKYFNIPETKSGASLGCSGYFISHFYYYTDEQTLNELALPICYLFDLYEYKEKQVKSFIQSNHTLGSCSDTNTLFQIKIELGDLYDDVALIYIYNIFNEDQRRIIERNDVPYIEIRVFNNSLNWYRYENVFGDQLYKVEKSLREEFKVRDKNGNLVA